MSSHAAVPMRRVYANRAYVDLLALQREVTGLVVEGPAAVVLQCR